jgi:anaerobic magnesium-protoporphyrin IX monomethyl ester cyclase
MKTLLLFPPQGDPFQPYSSLPALAGYLRENGRQASLRDLNIECHHFFTTPGRLSKACFRVRERLAELEKKPVLGYREQSRYMRLAKAALYGPMVVERIGWAKKVLRSKDSFYDLAKYTKALDIFHKALELISAEYFPSKITHVSFDCGYSPDSVLDILAATADRAQNPYIEFYQEEFVPELKRIRPDVVGISITYRHQLIPGFTLAEAVKAALPSAKIVIGGSFISSIAEKLPSCPSLFSLTDYFVVYEGEQALLKLIDCLERGGDPSSVPNLIYCEGGEVKRSEPFVIEDLNALPTPDLDDLPLDKYLSPDLVVLLPASRGCYWRKCTFCTVSGATNKRYRQRRVDLVVDDIEKLRAKYGSPYFFFSVDVMPAKALRNLSQALIDRAVECHWQCEVRLDPAFEYGLCDLISRAGCRNLMFGMESANQRVLDMMEKGTSADEFAGILRSCNAAGIATTLFCITGFPSETVEEAEDTLNFVLRHRDVITSATFSTFQLNEGSPVQLDPERYGIAKVNKTERDLRKDYSYEVSRGQTMLEAERTRQIIDETLDQVFTRRSYFTGLHPHILIHLARFKDPKFPESIAEERAAYSDADEIGAETVLMRRTSQESRTFGFDWRDLETRLSVARDQVEFAQLEDGLTPLEAEMLVERRTTPLPRDFVRVVYDPERDRYHFVSESAWRVVSMFNGGRLVEDILERVAPEARGKALRFIRKMAAAGLLTPSRKGDTSGVGPKGVGIRAVTRRAWA